MIANKNTPFFQLTQVDETEELAARGFFLGGANSSGPGFVLKM